MKRICLISVYFGEIPDYINTFIYSCGWNREFDFLLFVNKNVAIETPRNLKIIVIDKSELLDRINSRIKCNISDITPYKLCDYKTVYGVLFDDYLKDYDFWGMIDIDLILGKLSDYITESVLNRYDKIYTLGHLSLIKNDDRLNYIFKKDTSNSNNYLKVFGSDSNFIFDEIEGINEKFLDEGLLIYDKKDCVDSFLYGDRIEQIDRFLFELLQPKSLFSKNCTAQNYKYELFVLDCGRIFMVYLDNKKIKRAEYAYFHKYTHVSHKKLDECSRAIITTAGLVFDDTFFLKLDNGTLKKSDFQKYNKYSLLKRLAFRFGLYVRMNIRYFRKKYFPRKNEINI